VIGDPFPKWVPRLLLIRAVFRDTKPWAEAQPELNERIGLEASIQSYFRFAGNQDTIAKAIRPDRISGSPTQPRCTKSC